MTGQVVLFACIHNAGRSQMAAALFNAVADPSKARAISAGTRPGFAVHQEVAAVMHEIDIDLTSATPQRLTGELAAGVDMLVSIDGVLKISGRIPKSEEVRGWLSPEARG
jgi:arsenate reductase